MVKKYQIAALASSVVRNGSTSQPQVLANYFNER
jgi:hypothetical protein